MKFTVLSLFPQILEGFFTSSIMAKSCQRGLVDYRLVNIRDFALDKHKTCDDAPYGGGAGMVLKPEPVALALENQGVGPKEAEDRGSLRRRVVYLSPSGSLLTQARAVEYAALDELVLVCGRYEGLDQRIIDEYIDDEVSVGDYVLSSGETAALVLVDAVYRLLDGVINGESLSEESHQDGLLEYPHYTRPEVFHGRAVPPVLLGGNHAHIRTWRLEQRIRKTLEVRPDFLSHRDLSKEEQIMLNCALSHGGNDGSCQGTGSQPAKR